MMAFPTFPSRAVFPRKSGLVSIRHTFYAAVALFIFFEHRWNNLYLFPAVGTCCFNAIFKSNTPPFALAFITILTLKEPPCLNYRIPAKRTRLLRESTSFSYGIFAALFRTILIFSLWSCCVECIAAILAYFLFMNSVFSLISLGEDLRFFGICFCLLGFLAFPRRYAISIHNSSNCRLSETILLCDVALR